MSLLLEIGCEVEVGEEQKRKERNQESEECQISLMSGACRKRVLTSRRTTC
jgi:hypothetical protein